jgi:hypothetical protein
VSAAASGESIEERVHFPGSAALIYRLVASRAPGYNASLSDNTITITVPLSTLKEWEQNQEIGLYHRAEMLEIAIEKDLECVDARAEDRDPYAFPRKAAC